MRVFNQRGGFLSKPRGLVEGFFFGGRLPQSPCWENPFFQALSKILAIFTVGFHWSQALFLSSAGYFRQEFVLRALSAYSQRCTGWFKAVLTEFYSLRQGLLE